MPWDSIPAVSVADIDSTLSPCVDFYQYATGTWYRRNPEFVAVPLFPSTEQARRLKAEGRPTITINDIAWPNPRHVGAVLREFLEAAPALAPTVGDPTIRVLGYFYGSCLADTTGTDQRAVGADMRSSTCLQLTQQYLSSALITLVLERVWQADARAQSRMFWTNISQAAAERFRTSKALHDSTRQSLLTAAAGLKLSTSSNHLLLPLIDSIAPAWDRIPRHAYATLTLSPSDFAQNLARVRGMMEDSTAISPVWREALRNVVKTLLNDTFRASGEINLTLSWLVPARVNGTVDLGGWYGAVGKSLGHEIGHNFDGLMMRREYKQERERFAAEQFGNQLEMRLREKSEVIENHPFDDMFGILISHDAFERALRGRPRQRLEGFTPEQRFFLGIAQGMMKGGTPLPNTIANSPTRWRVQTNGALSMMPAFARAFDCKAGDPMAGGHVWYKDPWYRGSLTPEQRKTLYREFALEVGKDLWAKLSSPEFGWTKEQQDKLDHLTTTHGAQQEALVDSLGSATDHRAGERRMLHLIVQQLRDLRAQLGPTPEQGARFDRLEREWRQWHIVGAVLD